MKDHIAALTPIFADMERQLSGLRIAPDQPVTASTLPSVERVLEAATDDLVEVLRQLAEDRGALSTRAGRRTFKARYESPARRCIARQIHRLRVQVQSRARAAQPANEFLAAAIAEAING